MRLSLWAWTRLCRWPMPPVVLLAVLAAAFSTMAATAQQSDADLASAAQNPVAAMYSLPFQNNTYYGVGPHHDQTANVLNIQPVLPFSIGSWNVISRTIVPVISLPNLSTGVPEIDDASLFANSHFGLGDINQTFYISPAAAKGFIWGLGPSVTIPTATSAALGAGKVSMGPAAIGLIMPRPWVIGVLARQLWSVEGPQGRPNVSQRLLQPFVNYNLPGGWYLVSSPVVTANWNAGSADRWAVPIGGGAGKIFKIGGQPVNASLQAYDYLQKPSGGPSWALRFQVQFLFPR